MAQWVLYNDGSIIREPKNHSNTKSGAHSTAAPTQDGLRELQTIRRTLPQDALSKQANRW